MRQEDLVKPGFLSLEDAKRTARERRSFVARNRIEQARHLVDRSVDQNSVEVAPIAPRRVMRSMLGFIADRAAWWALCLHPDFPKGGARPEAVVLLLPLDRCAGSAAVRQRQYARWRSRRVLVAARPSVSQPERTGSSQTVYPLTSESSLLSIVGTSDSKEHPAREKEKTTAPRRGRIMRAIRATEDCWIGDLIGAVCLFGTIIAIFIIAGVLS